MLNIAEIVDRSAEKWPEKPFLLDGERRITFREFRSQVTRWAAFLRQEGVGEGKVVACRSRNTPEMLYLWMAANRLGAAFSPYNFNLNSRETGLLVTDSSPTHLFTDSEVRLEGPSAPRTRLLTWPDLPDGEPWEAVHPTQPDDMATLLYTSGTEDMPKGVVNTHLNWYATLMSALADLDMAHDDVFLLSIPVYHVAGLYTFLAFLHVGATIVLERTPSPAEIDRWIRSHGITYLIFPPTLFIGLAQLAREPYPSVTKCISFGAFLSATQFEGIGKLFPRASWRNYYGLTESTPVGTVLRPEDFLRKRESIGKPHVDVSLRLETDDGRPPATGEPGEILLRSPSVSPGYFHRPELTRERFRDGWLRTGDIGWRDEEGFLYFLDRKKDIVRTGGENVSSVEVEREILKDPRFAEVAVVGLPHPYWEEAVTAFVVPKANVAAPSEPEVLSALKGQLAAFKVPKKVIVIEALPHNASGKVLKKELRTRYRETFLPQDGRSDST